MGHLWQVVLRRPLPVQLCSTLKPIASFIGDRDGHADDQLSSGGERAGNAVLGLPSRRISGDRAARLEALRSGARRPLGKMLHHYVQGLWPQEPARLYAA